MGGEAKVPAGPDLGVGIAVEALADGASVVGRFEDDAVLLVRRGEEFFAIGATCSHYGGPLGEGLVVEDTVRCPWHHACFSLRTGEALRAPALNDVACYDVVRRGATVQVTGKRSAPGSVRERARRDATPASVGIIGAGAAGNSCAEELRRLGYEGPIVMVDPDGDAPYDRPNLSKDYLAANAPEEWIPLHPETHYRDQRIELDQRRVARLDPKSKVLSFEDGTRREFGALVLATGAEPIRLTIPGTGGPPIHTLRGLQDSRAIIAAASAGTQAVVLGASFIGLEVAASLRARNLVVHVVAPDRRPLEKVLGPELGDFIRTLHESHGVVFHLGTKTREVAPGQVVLEDGTRLAADFVVAGIGVRPRLELAEAAGLRIDKGVLVDTFLETSAPGVFAIGDVARYPDPVHRGETRRIEHWVHAQRMGQAVARNLAGLRRSFIDVPFFWSQHYDIVIAYVGHAETWDAIEIDGRPEAHDCIVRYRRSDAIAAVASIFRDAESLAAEVAMERQTAPA